MSRKPLINKKPFEASSLAQGRDFQWRPGHQAAMHRWMRELAGDTGCEYVVFVADKAWMKTRAQECGFHAMIAPLAKEKGWRIDDLKDWFLGQVFGWTTCKLTGKDKLVEPHTSDLNKAQYSELIERSAELAMEVHDVWLELPSEYTERKEKERKKAQRVAA